MIKDPFAPKTEELASEHLEVKASRISSFKRIYSNLTDWDESPVLNFFKREEGYTPFYQKHPKATLAALLFTGALGIWHFNGDYIKDYLHAHSVGSAVKTVTAPKQPGTKLLPITPPADSTNKGLEDTTKAVTDTTKSATETPCPYEDIPDLRGFYPVVEGFTKTSATLPLPDTATFEPKFSDVEEYNVRLPLEMRQATAEEKKSYGLKDTNYIVIRPCTKEIAEKNNLQGFGVNIVVDGKFISKSYNRAGETVFIPVSGDLETAVNSSDKEIRFQVMGLRQVGDSNYFYIVASYRNGVFDKEKSAAPAAQTTDYSLEAVIDSSDGLKTAGISESISASIDNYVAVGRAVRTEPAGKGYEPGKKSLTTLIEKYISTRNPSSNVIDNDIITQWTSDFEQGVKQAAECYKEARNQGMSHYESLRQTVDNSEMGAIQKSRDAYEALKLAQSMGDDVVIGRWDKRLVNEQKVSAYVTQLHSAIGTNGERLYTTKDILSQVEQQYGHTMSATTMGKYLKMNQESPMITVIKAA